MHVIKLVFLLLVFLLLYIYACMSIMQHVTPLVCFIYIYIYIHTICGYSIYIYIYIYIYIIIFPVVMNGCQSWTVKKAERRRIDAFELWCWRRLLRVP